MPDPRARILQQYHLSPADRISAGMEAEVFAYGPQRVLKLYAGTARLDDLLTLQDFYARLDRSRVPFGLPRIHALTQEGEYLVTVEERLPGMPMAALLPGLSSAEMERMLGRYLDALLALSAVPAPEALARIKLFDPQGISGFAQGGWHGFLARALERKVQELDVYLRRDVSLLDQKVDRLRAFLAQPYTGEYRLIHGDFFPGNLLVDAQGQVCGLLDFGLLTMYGDPLFDLATGWLFFDMYDELHANLRARLLGLILERLGEGVRGRLFRYGLFYSILGANTYSPQCADGHYRWCVDNLNRQEYWDGADNCLLPCQSSGRQKTASSPAITR
jgi:aminoglycoside phosphotransferase